MSKGMKRKVAIARSLVNDPDVLVYDEPASGLDPLTTNYVLEFTRALADEGKTVLFSAHNLYHVESVCDRVVVMNRGDVVARGRVPEIRDEHGTTVYRVFTTVPVEGSDPVDGTDRHVVVVDSMADVEAVREAAAAAGDAVADLRTDEPSLEDIFLGLTGDRATDAPREAPTADPPRGRHR
jgi:ABC-2 type transport system ATP-binding protein